MRRQPRATLRIFAVPALLAVLGLAGLLAALLGDGLWDAVSWLALGGLVATSLVFALRRPR